MIDDEPPMPDRSLTCPPAEAETSALYHLLRAELDPETGAIRSANAPLRQLARLDERLATGEPLRLVELFRDFDTAAWERRVRRSLLPLLLQQFYGVMVADERLQAEPTVACLAADNGGEPHYLLFWLRLELASLERRDRQRDELAGVDVAALLRENPPSQQIWDERIDWDNYAIAGRLLWEGCDITSRETVQRLVQMLADPDGSLARQHLAAVAAPLCRLFRASHLALWEARSRQWQLLSAEAVATPPDWPAATEWTSPLLEPAAEPIGTLGDLQQEAAGLGCDWQSRGWRSLLLTSVRRTGTDDLLGVVLLASEQPHQFDQVDAERATALLPGWRAAFGRSRRQDLSRVHPSVAWRFQEEAERRSLGLSPQPIVFEQVYPMYGISDIRGSSDERNRAIQADLLAQFELALATVTVARDEQPNALLDQLRLDLLDYTGCLQQGLQAEDEVTAVRYLRQHFEIYFDYFQRCGGAVAAAANTYWQAVDNQQHCVYAARDRYDRTILAIANQLRATWARWQETMQGILPHYCDLEVSDGIDHRLYVGASIDPRFSRFHLHSLRYEQLRAMCDAARACFKLAEQTGEAVQVSHLVLVQDVTVDIFHDEQTERVFDVRGSRDPRYEIVKKRIDKGLDTQTRQRITQPGMLTIVYSTEAEWREYHQYLRYLLREGWIEKRIESGTVAALPGVAGLRYARVAVRPAAS